MDRRPTAEASTQTASQKAQDTKYNQDKATMGGGDGKVKYKIQP